MIVGEMCSQSGEILSQQKELLDFLEKLDSKIDAIYRLGCWWEEQE